jgi:hypothetical protein
MDMEQETINMGKKVKKILTREQITDKKNKKRDKKERKMAIEVAIATIESMLQRQNHCQEPSVRYALLANTLMLIFDAISAAAIIFSSDLDDEFKCRIRQSVDNLQSNLGEMMQWIADGGEKTTEVGYTNASPRMTI